MPDGVFTGTTASRHRPGNERAGRVGDVRGDDAELRFGEARAERGLGDVELVVAERRPVEPEQVQDVDHLAAVEPLAVHARRPERRRRQVVAAERRQQLGMRAPSAARGALATRASPPAFPPSTGVIS